MPGVNKHLDAEHGVVCDLGDDEFGYFGWPSVARTQSGKLVVAASGLRWGHVCPWGKTVLFTSLDDGATWSDPFVLNDTPLDDRDAGIVSLGREELLLTWFTSDTREIHSLDNVREDIKPRWIEAIDAISDEERQEWRGSWLRTSADGGENWGDLVRAPLNTPHGPIRLVTGDLLYFGKNWWKPGDEGSPENVGAISAALSRDSGATWRTLGSVPLPEDVIPANVHEPHVVELSSGKLIGLIRHSGDGHFSMLQSESDDRGHTWTEAHPTDVLGSPPHVIRHSTEPLVCVYGYRLEPYGERAMISRDRGRTWDADWVLRDDGPEGDLGYPASVELGDGRIFTVYYQKPHARKNCALLCSTWRLPAKSS